MEARAKAAAAAKAARLKKIKDVQVFPYFRNKCYATWVNNAPRSLFRH
jgi:predicted GNAT family acetyltransferase